MIELNHTLLFQVVGFFVLLFILNRFLYTPLLRVLKEREERTEGALKKAQETEKEIEDGLSAYDRKIKDASVKGYEEISRLRQEALEREKAMIEAARKEAAEKLEDMRVQIGKSRDSALRTLKEEAKTLSVNIAEKIIEKKLILMLVTLILPLVPALVHAAEEGEGGGSNEIIYKLVNFAIIAAGAVIVWKKAIKGLLEKRGAGIKKALEDARSAREAADRKAAEYREKLALLEKRIEELHIELKAEGEAEMARMLLAAEDAINKIKEQTKFTAGQELKKAKLEIRKEVAETAVTLAEELLKREMTPGDQERLIKGYLEKLKLTA